LLPIIDCYFFVYEVLTIVVADATAEAHNYYLYLIWLL